MRKIRLISAGVIAACASALLTIAANAQAAEMGAEEPRFNKKEYVLSLSKLNQADKEGGADLVMEMVAEPKSGEQLRAYADWLRQRVVETNTRDSRYYWAYSHVLMIGGIRDSASAMYATAVLMTSAESARCADKTSVTGRRVVNVLLSSSLAKVFGEQPYATRQKAVEIALQLEKSKRSGEPATWACGGGMDEMMAAMKAADVDPSVKSAKSADGAVTYQMKEPYIHPLKSDAEFEVAVEEVRKSFASTFAGEPGQP